MNSTQRLARRPTAWLRASQLAPYADDFRSYFTECRYAPQTIATNLGCIARFVR